jgi:transcriptional antiterminator RfaH
MHFSNKSTGLPHLSEPTGAEVTGEAQSLGSLPASFTSGFGWYVVYTNIKCEQRARMGLCAKGFAVYLPTFQREIRHARRVKLVERPLFPRYLFVGFDINRDPWTEVRRTDGVERLLSHEEIPVRVPHGVVEELRAAAQLVARVEKAAAPTPPIPGDCVKIGDGAFRDFVVQVVSAPDERDRVEILMNVLGGERKIKMALSALRPRAQS